MEPAEATAGAQPEETKQTVIAPTAQPTNTNTTDNVEEEQPPVPLFKPPRIKKAVYWQFISLIAPSYEDKQWTSADALGAYCLRCKCKLNWSSTSHKAVQRHMERYHNAFLHQNDDPNTPNNKFKLEQDEDPPKAFFDAVGVRNQEYWQCIKYIAPSEEKKNWKHTDAVGVYCLQCNTRINYDGVKNTKGVKRHMEKHHPELLIEYRKKNPHPKFQALENGGTDNKSRKRKSMDSQFMNSPLAVPPHSQAPTPQSQQTPFKQELPTTPASIVTPGFASPQLSTTSTLLVATEAMKKQFNRLVALWTATSLRPLSITEDLLLKDLFDFASTVNGTLPLPDRHSNQRTLLNEAEMLTSRIQSDIEEQCLFFACASETWLNKGHALMINFLTERFEMRSYTLEVKALGSCRGLCAGDVIQRNVSDAFRRWKLNSSFLNMMLHDGSIAEVCRDWGARQFPSIGHALHMIVGPVLLKRQSTQTGMGSSHGDGNIEVIEDYFQDCFDDNYENQSDIAYVRSLVQDMRKLCAIIKNSSKSIKKIESLKRQLSDEVNAVPPSTSTMAVRTRWSSTLVMLNRMVKSMGSLNEFIEYYNSPLGDESGVMSSEKSMALPEITSEKWAIIQGLCYLLTSFEKATVMLSSDQYSTFVSALPILCKLKAYIGDPSMFNFDGPVIHLTRTKKMYYDLYGKQPFFPQVLRRLEQIRVLLYSEFIKQFSNIDDGILWSSLLDPRFGMTSLHWKGDDEKQMAKKMLISEVTNMALTRMEGQDNNNFHNSITPSSQLDQSFGDDDFMFDLHHQSAESVASSEEKRHSEEQKMNDTVTREVDAYLKHIGGFHGRLDPLVWWRENQAKYPSLAMAARKWLCVTIVQTASERVLSICDMMDAGRRSQVDGDLMEKQVFIYNNYDKCKSLGQGKD